jgi:hypothetical protein
VDFESREALCQRRGFDHHEANPMEWLVSRFFLENFLDIEFVVKTSSLAKTPYLEDGRELSLTGGSALRNPPLHASAKDVDPEMLTLNYL